MFAWSPVFLSPHFPSHRGTVECSLTDARAPSQTFQPL